MQKYISLDSESNESSNIVIFNDENNEFTGSFNIVKDNVKTNITDVFSSKDDISKLETGLSNINDSLSEIKNLIPEDASKENQLADKKFVTDSISTNSATFRGTFDSVSKLPTTGIDNNDYAIVKTETDVNNQTYTRYKYDGSEWVEEFTLNNTPFNSEQWDAINSGIKSTTLSGYSTIGHTHTKSEIDDFPTNVGSFTNNVGYITISELTSITQKTLSEFNAADTLDEKLSAIEGLLNSITELS